MQQWTNVASLAQLEKQSSLTIKHDGKQIALFNVEGALYAIDNRCPHEGYPLREGTLDGASCVLTCQWHNWKFDLKTGQCLVGEDHVRTYPVRTVEGEIHIDLSDPDPELKRASIMRGLMEAVEKDQYGRITRELARMESAGLSGLPALKEVLRRMHDRLEWGTTHAWPAAADWIARYHAAGDDLEKRVICMAEAIDHLAKDCLREPVYPYATTVAPFATDLFLAAIEQEDEPQALALLRGAIAAGLTWAELEPCFSRAALAHYLDFGHGLIYVAKTSELIAEFGQDLLLELTLPLVRALIYGTREDKLPDFKAYAPILAQPPESYTVGRLPADERLPYARTVRASLEWTRDALKCASPEAVYEALMQTAAMQLLAFDEDFMWAYHRPVKHNVNWLGFTHALTFGNALRRTCSHHPELWWPGLLQLACFLGRNTPYLKPDQHFDFTTPRDRPAFFARMEEKLLDHGLREPIFACHLLKTATAIAEEVELFAPASAEALCQALEHFLNAQIKQKHVRRTARQALALLK